MKYQAQDQYWFIKIEFFLTRFFLIKILKQILRGIGSNIRTIFKRITRKN